MEPDSLAHSLFAIPELLDHTIDILSESLVDLHSCALVSKSWVPRAQFHIFEKIILWRFDSVSDDMKLLRRLMKILEVSPHLAHFIRHLSISLNIDLLEGIVGMTLPRLEELYVECTFYQYRGLDDMTTRFHVQSLLRRPTVRSVELYGAFTSISVIRAYFDNCTHIQRLGLISAHVVGTENMEDLEASNPNPALGASKIQLSHITFPARSSEELDAWIVGPHCPFGFQRLRSVHIPEPRWRLFRSLLAPGLGSIEYLKLLNLDDRGDRVLDLSGFTNLKQLDVHVGASLPLPNLIAALQSLPPNNSLQTMGLLQHFVFAGDEKVFKDFDTIIPTLDAMHSLRRVEIYIRRGLRSELDVECFRSYFPTLASKGYLFIHSYDLYGLEYR
ncbi:hypothetical protein MSAN_00345800 [Mycena sanguinolenta]|uniref:F-box domain-containing protein n=1 Tax=Mycena sanguinolenta TaxID=230812 RepID=A0A8H6ZBK5_9AGAR|nr:hypothetical protein MSAN_00345800 [Mycena sanguinolenta]